MQPFFVFQRCNLLKKVEKKKAFVNILSVIYRTIKSAVESFQDKSYCCLKPIVIYTFFLWIDCVTKSH